MWSSHFIQFSNILSSQFHQLHIVFHLHSMDLWPFWHSWQWLTEKTAKDATTIATDTILPISLSSFIQVINGTIRDAPKTHEWVALVYQHRRVSCDAKQTNNRKDDVLLARLQAGHRTSLKQYLNRFYSSQDPICLNCCLEEQDLLHWLCDCPALMTVRQRVFGNYQVSLE